VAIFVVCSVAAAAQQPRTTWDGVYTAEQARRGAALYKTHCSSCHGDALMGAEAAPALVGDTFNGTWEGVPLADLFERVRATMPQDKPGSLSRAQNADILSYILEVGKFPAGAAQLDAQALMGITYRTYRP
jgi:mono/diheme cytochrome c family protein